MKNKKKCVVLLFTIICNIIVVSCFVLGLVLFFSSTRYRLPDKINESDFVKYMENKGCSIINMQEKENLSPNDTYLVTDSNTCPYLISYVKFSDQKLLTNFFTKAKHDVLYENGNLTKSVRITLDSRYQEYSTIGNSNYKVVTLNRNTVLYASGSKEYKDDISSIFEHFNYSYKFSVNPLSISLLLIFSFTLLLIIIVSMWKVEEKTRNKGWISIIPFYNIVCLSKDILGSGWYALLLFLPGISSAIIMFFLYKLGKQFDKSNLYCALLMIFPTIFWPLLAFDDSTYIENEKISTTTNNNDNTPVEYHTKYKDTTSTVEIKVETEEASKWEIIKWIITSICIFLTLIVIILYFEEKIVGYLLLAVLLIISGIMVCPRITEYTTRYKRYTKYKPLIVTLIFIIIFVLFGLMA